MIVIEGVAEVTDLDTVLATLDAVADEYGVTVQAFDARYLVGRRHLERAVELADRAFDRGENVARERSVEILLYAAGRRQIDDALEMGVREGRTPVAVAVVVDGEEPRSSDGEAPPTPRAERDDVPQETGHSSVTTDAVESEAAAADALHDRLVLDPAATLSSLDAERVRAFFDVTAAELDAVDGDLTDLVCERVALLDVEK
ncbi:KEOPS complex subunit Cgi121 [Haloplanus litoreus]|uniref:KEOPS complex subunit Cgi121 n=1 Tax=Haloplanus litoreus TaxID=767515 RepID=A0ABD5ZVE7_9EURY